ncbi:hypothetical protein DPMN_041683 [Dreissena polymorpha]|uniref:Uncharacterized protein n=1 Tax=Dreissena polymorpha TaxID=45954 RepID=A0A9D4HY44_DREPO|nr:hypothetical protein DPMN_041683 [Dreissena polymorpha]
METFAEDGNKVTDNKSVLKIWKREFQKLFDKAEACEGENFDKQFYEEVKKFKLELEQQFSEAENVNDAYSYPMLNATKSVAEVIKALSNC